MRDIGIDLLRRDNIGRAAGNLACGLLGFAAPVERRGVIRIEA
jgi:hypothetical protein